MKATVDNRDVQTWRVESVTRDALVEVARWPHSFADQRRDRRYYEALEDTLDQGFVHGYLLLRDAAGKARAVQPYILLDQDLLQGSGPRAMAAAATVRRALPRALTWRTLMVGCAAGEGRLDADPGDEASRMAIGRALAAGLVAAARPLGAKLVVMKEFPRADRTALAPLEAAGFARMPSMPHTRLRLDYRDFEDYITRALSGQARHRIRKALRRSAELATLELEVTADIRPHLAQVFPLYAGVLAKAALVFERLTPEFFAQLSARMPDKVRWFLWRLDGRVVAFALCLVGDGSISADYVGFDYDAPKELALYYTVVRGVTDYAIAHDLRDYHSTGLNYAPKHHLRHQLDPVDLYVRHVSPLLNPAVKRVMPLAEPTRNDPDLKLFANYADLA